MMPGMGGPGGPGGGQQGVFVINKNAKRDQAGSASLSTDGFA